MTSYPKKIAGIAIPSLALITACMFGCGTPPPPAAPTPGYVKWLCTNPVVSSVAPKTANWWTNFAGAKGGTSPFEACISTNDGEAEARAQCSDRCYSLSYDKDPGGYHCSDASWNPVEVTTSGCSTDDYVFDPVPIQAALGLTAANEAADLPCGLNMSCAEFFPIAAREQLWLNPTTSAYLTADTHAQTSTSNPSYMAFLGTGQTTASTMTLTGNAAYTAVDAVTCGADACPFYLAQVDAAQGTGNWSVALTVGGFSGPPTTVTKQLSGVSFGLARPALGAWLPNSGDVIFAPYALTLKVDATVGGTTNTYGENGSYTDIEYINYGYVFGHVDGTSFTLDYEQADTLGNMALSLYFEP